jgi:uncharacterized protein (TIGR03067 family)
MNLPRGQLALHVMDSRTFIVADLAPMKKFLEDKGKPADFKPPVEAAPAPPPAAPPPPGPKLASAPSSGGKAADPRPSNSFRTIAPALKAILDEMETAAREGESVLLREAVSGSSAFHLLRLVADQVDQQWNTKGDLARLVRKQVGSNPNAGGFCLLALNETNLSLGVAAHLLSPARAQEAEKQVALVLPPLFKAADLDLARDGVASKPGLAAVPPATGTATQGKDGTWSAWSHGQLVACTLRLSLADPQYQAVVAWLSELMASIRVWAEMAETRPRVRELAEAIQAYVRDKGSFPRGALDRVATAAHPVPWPPDQRLSWLVDLLPYLPGGDYGALVMDREQGWNEGVNLVAGQMPIPHFLAPIRSTNSSWRWVWHWGQYWPLAASHYVGIAGVGLDAADYLNNDPKTAARLGIFGYDRVTRPADIKDGLANTIVAVQVPAEKARPWMAGGGSTVRAVSEDDDCVQPFVCLDYRGRRGTFALMADGKVRFIPATIPPAVFRALCTIAGGETIKDLDQVAPVVEEEDAGELKTDTPSVSSPPVAASGTGVPAPTTADGTLLQGTWSLVQRESNGKTMSPEEAKKVVLNIVGDRFLLRAPGGSSWVKTFKLDPEKKPKWIDLTDAETKTVAPGIYEVSVEQLKLCVALPQAPTEIPEKRPGVFNSTNADLLVFQRAEDPALLREMEKLRGTWALMNGDIDGIEIAPAVAANARLSVDGYQYSLTLNGRTNEGTLILELKTGDAGGIDVITLDGKVLHGLYFWSTRGEQLILCIAGPGAPRPSEMQGGLGIQFLKFKRVHSP